MKKYALFLALLCITLLLCACDLHDTPLAADESAEAPEVSTSSDTLLESMSEAEPSEMTDSIGADAETVPPVDSPITLSYTLGYARYEADGGIKVHVCITNGSEKDYTYPALVGTDIVMVSLIHHDEQGNKTIVATSQAMDVEAIATEDRTISPGSIERTYSLTIPKLAPYGEYSIRLTLNAVTDYQVSVSEPLFTLTQKPQAMEYLTYEILESDYRPGGYVKVRATFTNITAYDYYIANGFSQPGPFISIYEVLPDGTREPVFWPNDYQYHESEDVHIVKPGESITVTTTIEIIPEAYACNYGLQIYVTPDICIYTYLFTLTE